MTLPDRAAHADAQPVAEVARRTAERIEKLLRKAGHSLAPDMVDDSQPESEPGPDENVPAEVQSVDGRDR